MSQTTQLRLSCLPPALSAAAVSILFQLSTRLFHVFFVLQRPLRSCGVQGSTSHTSQQYDSRDSTSNVTSVAALRESNSTLVSSFELHELTADVEKCCIRATKPTRLLQAPAVFFFHLTNLFIPSINIRAIHHVYLSAWQYRSSTLNTLHTLSYQHNTAYMFVKRHNLKFKLVASLKQRPAGKSWRARNQLGRHSADKCCPPTHRRCTNVCLAIYPA